MIATIPYLRRFANADEWGNHVSLEHILRGEPNGYILENYLTPEEVSSLMKGFRSCTETELIRIHEGFTSYPMSFAQFDQMANAGVLTETNYHESSAKFIRDFPQRFGVDIIGKMQDLFQQLSPEVRMEVPVNENGAPYTPFTFRELFPGEGCLKAHCENLFFQEFPSFFDRINRFSIQADQLSFFFVLQEAGEGGELTLYDLLWEDEQRRLNDTVISTTDGRELSVEDSTQLERNTYPVPTGSLVIFSGGSIWHRVETIRRAPSRITLGGFLSFSPDRTKLYSWS